jgi:hypothetical protein
VFIEILIIDVPFVDFFDLPRWDFGTVGKDMSPAGHAASRAPVPAAC